MNKEGTGDDILLFTEHVYADDYFSSNCLAERDDMDPIRNHDRTFARLILASRCQTRCCHQENFLMRRD